MGELTTPLYQQTDTDVPDNDPYSYSIFLSADTVYVDAVNKTNFSQWKITVTVGAHPVLFKLGTVAEVTYLIVREGLPSFYDSMLKLQKSTHTLQGVNYNFTPL